LSENCCPQRKPITKTKRTQTTARDRGTFEDEEFDDLAVSDGFDFVFVFAFAFASAMLLVLLNPLLEFVFVVLVLLNPLL
jgi:hypothetical protein